MNPFRQFCHLKGITGKGKKMLRRALRERARAKIALANERSSGGLVNA